jgi:hypothetical protein
MYLGRADMLCPPVVSGFVPEAVLQARIANKKKPGTRYPRVRASISTVKTSTYLLERVRNHVGRDLSTHVLAGADRESIVNAAPDADILLLLRHIG